MVYELKFRKNLHFHNGDPFSAEDVKFSLERFKGAGKELHAKVPKRFRSLTATWGGFA